MIHWKWLILAFFAGFYAYGYIMVWAESRHYRRDVADLHEGRSHKVKAEDFEQELELHKN